MPLWGTVADTGSLEPIPEAAAWAQRADAWAQQPAEQSGWAEVVPTARPGFPAEGVGWRTETAEWRATEQTARWRQTTEWRSSSGSHGWRSTTEAWQTGSGAEGFIPPTDPPVRQQLAISGSAWPTPADEQAGEPAQLWQPNGAASWQQNAAGQWQQAAPTQPPAPAQPPAPTHWQQPAAAQWAQPAAPPWEQPQPAAPQWEQQRSTPSWQQPADPTQNWQQPAGSTPSWQQSAGSTPSWQQPAEPTQNWQQPAASTPSWQQPAPSTPSWQQPSGSNPSWQPAEPTPSWQQPAQPPPPAWERAQPSWQAPVGESHSGRIDDGSHLVREDDRAQWRRESAAGRTAAESGPLPVGRRRAPEAGGGQNPGGGTGWAARTDTDNWAGHTDTGSMSMFQAPPAPDVPTWGAREDAPGWRDGDRRSDQSRDVDPGPGRQRGTDVAAQIPSWRRDDVRPREIESAARSVPAEPPTPAWRDRPAEPPTPAWRDRPAEPPTPAWRDRPVEPPTQAWRDRPAEPPTPARRDRPVEPPTQAWRDRPAEPPTPAWRDRPAGPSDTGSWRRDLDRDSASGAISIPSRGLDRDGPRGRGDSPDDWRGRAAGQADDWRRDLDSRSGEIPVQRRDVEASRRRGTERPREIEGPPNSRRESGRDNTGDAPGWQRDEPATDWRDRSGGWRAEPDSGSWSRGEDPRTDSWRRSDGRGWRDGGADPAADPWSANAADTGVLPATWQQPETDPVDWRPTGSGRRRSAGGDGDGRTTGGGRRRAIEPRAIESGPIGNGSRAEARADPVSPDVWRGEGDPRQDRANPPTDKPHADWRRELREEVQRENPDPAAVTQIHRRADPNGWPREEVDTGRGNATYRERNTGDDWRRELAAESGAGDGEAPRYGEQEFVPFRPVGSAPVASQSAPPAAPASAPPRAGSWTNGSGMNGERPQLLVGNDDRGGSRWQDPPDTQWPPRGAADGYQGGIAGGGYERRSVSSLTGSFSRQNNLLEPDDDDDLEADNGGPLAAVGYTIIWYGVPVVLFVLYMLVLNGSQQAQALSTLANAAPQFGLSLVLSMLVAVGLRWASGTWKSASVGLAAAVMGGGLATVLTSAITGNALT